MELTIFIIRPRSLSTARRRRFAIGIGSLGRRFRLRVGFLLLGSFGSHVRGGKYKIVIQGLGRSRPDRKANANHVLKPMCVRRSKRSANHHVNSLIQCNIWCNYVDHKYASEPFRLDTQSLGSRTMYESCSESSSMISGTCQYIAGRRKVANRYHDGPGWSSVEL